MGKKAQYILDYGSLDCRVSINRASFHKSSSHFSYASRHASSASGMVDWDALEQELLYGTFILILSFSMVHVYSKLAEVGSVEKARPLARINKRRAVPLAHDDTSQPLDPIGGTWLKQQAALGMASIARYRESKKAASWTLASLEGFHECDMHAFWNESYYWNGCDLATRDRIITRISHRGVGAQLSYTFLLLDLTDYGTLTLEVDDLAWSAETPTGDSRSNFNVNPRAAGLVYECVNPLQTWCIRYEGYLRQGHRNPWKRGVVDTRRHVASVDDEGSSNYVKVKIDLKYENHTPTFWYMRDDKLDTLAKNLSQETWGLDFVRYCLSRSKNHCHYESWGSLKGTIQVEDNEPRTYDFGTFRDHSWDIRLWATMDQLFILLLTLEEPIVIGSQEYWYLDLTLVFMPGNSGGVQRWTTGWLGGKQAAGGKATGSLSGNLPVVSATSVLDVGYAEIPEDPINGIPARREPLPESETLVEVGLDSIEELAEKHIDKRFKNTFKLKVECSGPIRRLQYWPDRGRFEVFEDTMDIRVNGIKAYGTRQSGFRIGSYDPAEGGCG